MLPPPVVPPPVDPLVVPLEVVELLLLPGISDDAVSRTCSTTRLITLRPRSLRATAAAPAAAPAAAATAVRRVRVFAALRPAALRAGDLREAEPPDDFLLPPELRRALLDDFLPALRVPAERFAAAFVPRPLPEERFFDEDLRDEDEPLLREEDDLFFELFFDELLLEPRLAEDFFEPFFEPFFDAIGSLLFNRRWGTGLEFRGRPWGRNAHNAHTRCTNQFRRTCSDCHV